MNKIFNSLMNSNKLQLNKLKYTKVHVGKKYNECPKLLVQNELTKNSDMEKYLGDIIHKDGKRHATIVKRLAKGYGIVANLFAHKL